MVFCVVVIGASSASQLTLLKRNYLSLILFIESVTFHTFEEKFDTFEKKLLQLTFLKRNFLKRNYLSLSLFIEIVTLK